MAAVANSSSNSAIVTWPDTEYGSRVGRSEYFSSMHCMSMGHPIIGDRKYGRAEPLPLRLAAGLHLHARSVTFKNPVTGQDQTLTAPLLSPDDGVAHGHAMHTQLVHATLFGAQLQMG